MPATDKTEFAALLARTWIFYGKRPTGEEVAAWYGLFESLPLDALSTAFQRHLTDPERGQYLPKPADIIRHITAAQTDDGRPGPDEAWGLLLRVIRDERETGVLTDEMRAGWAACQPILDLGDEVGARRCFLEAYARAVAEARQQRQRARWTVTLGTDPALRQQRLAEAVEARRIGAEQVKALLPGPTPASLDQVAGLLEGPNATLGESHTAERFRALANLLRASSAASEQRRAEERQRQRDQENERKREIQRLIDQHDTSQRQDAA